MRIVICVILLLIPQFPVPAAAQSPNFPVASLTVGILNGTTAFPFMCGATTKPSWCGSGTTPDKWILAACSALQGNAGIVDLANLSGNVVATTRGCSTPTKKIVFIQDPAPAAPLTITETDGDISFPLDENSMFLGFGSGGCQPNQGINVDPSANITAVIGPAHTDATQEQLTVQGVCIYGNQAATISKGILYSESNFANTTISNNNIFECPIACVRIINSSSIQLLNNWLNVTDGSSSPGRALWIQSLTQGGSTGCRAGQIFVIGGQVEHSFGGVPDIDVSGDGAGAIVCGIHLESVGVERNNVSGSTIGINLSDCWNCYIDNALDSGTNGGTDFIKISQTAAGRSLNNHVTNLNPGGTYTNVINDTTPGGLVLPVATNPQITEYVSQPGANSQSLYSAATNPLPTCAAAVQGQQKLVSDATSPTYLGTYASGGNITAQVICSYNGSTYGWVTH